MEKRYVNVPDPRNPGRMTKGLVVGFKALKEGWRRVRARGRH